MAMLPLVRDHKKWNPRERPVLLGWKGSGGLAALASGARANPRVRPAGSTGLSPAPWATNCWMEDRTEIL